MNEFCKVREDKVNTQTNYISVQQWTGNWSSKTPFMMALKKVKYLIIYVANIERLYMLQMTKH